MEPVISEIPIAERALKTAVEAAAKQQASMGEEPNIKDWMKAVWSLWLRYLHCEKRKHPQGCVEACLQRIYKQADI